MVEDKLREGKEEGTEKEQIDSADQRVMIYRGSGFLAVV
jgi:hypothetical protein